MAGHRKEEKEDRAWKEVRKDTEKRKRRQGKERVEEGYRKEEKQERGKKEMRKDTEKTKKKSGQGKV